MTDETTRCSVPLNATAGWNPYPTRVGIPNTYPGAPAASSTLAHIASGLTAVSAFIATRR